MKNFNLRFYVKLSAIGLVIIYWLFVLINANFNIVNWSEISRIFSAVIISIWLIVVSLIDNEPKKGK